MTLALLCQFTAQHVSDVNTSIFSSLRLFVALLCRLTWGVLVLCSGIGCWWCGIRVQAEPLLVQPALGYRITNSQSRYITPTRLKLAHYSPHNNAPSSRKLLKMDILTSGTCWAVNWHNKASVIKLVYLYSNIVYVYILISKIIMYQYLSAKIRSTTDIHFITILGISFTATATVWLPLGQTDDIQKPLGRIWWRSFIIVPINSGHLTF